MPATTPPYRIEIDAPDGYSVLALERRLAHLASTKVARASGWVLSLDGVEALDEVQSVVAAWLHELGLPSTHVVVDGTHLHVEAAPGEQAVNLDRKETA